MRAILGTCSSLRGLAARSAGNRAEVRLRLSAIFSGRHPPLPSQLFEQSVCILRRQGLDLGEDGVRQWKAAHRATLEPQQVQATAIDVIVTPVPVAPAVLQKAAVGF